MQLTIEILISLDFAQINSTFHREQVFFFRFCFTGFDGRCTSWNISIFPIIPVIRVLKGDLRLNMRQLALFFTVPMVLMSYSFVRLIWFGIIFLSMNTSMGYMEAVLGLRSDTENCFICKEIITGSLYGGREAVVFLVSFIVMCFFLWRICCLL